MMCIKLPIIGRACAVKLLFIVIAASISSTTSAQRAVPSCPVQYTTTATLLNTNNVSPLLLGGVWDGCQSGCQPRTDTWSAVCKADPDALSIINVCEASQRSAILEVADRISNGGIRDFSPCELHSFMANRTLWIIGDSHTKNMYNALRCFMVDFWDHSQGECAASHITLLQQLLEKAALRGHIFNTPPRCLHLLGGGRICLVHNPIGATLLTDDPDDPGTLQLLRKFFAASHDIFYISFGRWHSNNCNGVDPSYAQALEALGAYLKEQRSTFPHVFFAPSLHDHTVCSNGAMNDSLPYCPPAAEGGYSLEIGATLQRQAYEIMTVKNDIPVVESYAASLFLNNGHVLPRQTIAGKADCLHYCRPGMPEIEIWYMTKAFKSTNISRGVYLPVVPQYRCFPIQPQAYKPFGATNRAPSAPVLSTIPVSQDITVQITTQQNALSPTDSLDSSTTAANALSGVNVTDTPGSSPPASAVIVQPAATSNPHVKDASQLIAAAQTAAAEAPQRQDVSAPVLSALDNADQQPAAGVQTQQQQQQQPDHVASGAHAVGGSAPISSTASGGLGEGAAYLQLTSGHDQYAGQLTENMDTLKAAFTASAVGEDSQAAAANAIAEADAAAAAAAKGSSTGGISNGIDSVPANTNSASSAAAGTAAGSPAPVAVKQQMPKQQQQPRWQQQQVRQMPQPAISDMPGAATPAAAAVSAPPLQHPAPALQQQQQLNMPLQRNAVAAATDDSYSSSSGGTGSSSGLNSDLVLNQIRRKQVPADTGRVKIKLLNVPSNYAHELNAMENDQLNSSPQITYAQAVAGQTEQQQQQQPAATPQITVPWGASITYPGPLYPAYTQPDWASGFTAAADMGNVVTNMQLIMPSNRPQQQYAASTTADTAAAAATATVGGRRANIQTASVVPGQLQPIMLSDVHKGGDEISNNRYGTMYAKQNEVDFGVEWPGAGHTGSSSSRLQTMNEPVARDVDTDAHNNVAVQRGVPAVQMYAPAAPVSAARRSRADTAAAAAAPMQDVVLPRKVVPGRERETQALSSIATQQQQGGVALGSSNSGRQTPDVAATIKSSVSQSVTTGFVQGEESAKQTDEELVLNSSEPTRQQNLPATAAVPAKPRAVAQAAARATPSDTATSTAAARVAAPAAAAATANDLDILVDGSLMIENPWASNALGSSSSNVADYTSSSSREHTPSGSRGSRSSSSPWSRFGNLLTSVTAPVLPMLGRRS